MPYTLTCTQCHLNFLATRRDARFCSDACRYAAKNARRRVSHSGQPFGSFVSTAHPLAASDLARPLWPDLRPTALALLRFLASLGDPLATSAADILSGRTQASEPHISCEPPIGHTEHLLRDEPSSPELPFASSSPASDAFLAETIAALRLARHARGLTGPVPQSEIQSAIAASQQPD